MNNNYKFHIISQAKTNYNLFHNDYYPYGMLVPTRNYSNPVYRYGFQGQEKDNEIKGIGNSINYKFRMHDPRVGRFFAVDPEAKKYSFQSPYAFATNNPVRLVDVDGLGVDKKEDWFVNKKTGALVYIQGEKELNKETATQAFGKENANLIFNNAKNDYKNWERLGDDTMFDTPDNKVSENGNDFKPESVAEDFAKSKGYLKGIKERVKVVNTVSYDSDGNAGVARETSVSEIYPLTKGITYAKRNGVEYIPGGKIMHHYGGRTEISYEDRITVTSKKKSNAGILFKIGKEVILLGIEIFKKH